MTPSTLAALRGSIAKWWAIVDGTGRDKGPSNCPLCGLFYRDNCVGCPVREAAGDDLCCGTPYEEWADAVTDEARAEAAQAELAFLVSLLPDGEAS